MPDNDVMKTPECKEWHAVLHIGDREVRVNIDKGASCNVNSNCDYEMLSKAQPASRLNKCHTKMTS